MKIIDLTEEKPAEVEKKKIHLVSCLQSAASDKTGDNYFYEVSGGYSLKSANSVARVSKNASKTGMDLIIINKGCGDEIWLGHWNDGVI
jgi:hypothetical protein